VGGIAAILMGLPMIGIPMAMAGGAMADGTRKKPPGVAEPPAGPGIVPKPPNLNTEVAGGRGGSWPGRS